MMSIFNSFDFYIFGSKFIIPLFIFLYFLTMNICKISFLNLGIKEFFSTFSQLVYLTKSKNMPKFMGLFFNSIFLTIFLLNFNSIFPYSFSFTTQMSMILFLSLTIWVSFFLFSFKNNFKMLISHKIPEGSPLGLSIFLFLIEIVSDVIRPLTLTLRLVGNMVVGHVLLMLLFKLLSFFYLVSPIFLILNMVEVLVCFIQSYIFYTLLSMYFSEI